MYSNRKTADSTSEPRLLDQVREAIRVRHYSIRTEESYVQWIRRFILFHDKRHPKEMVSCFRITIRQLTKKHLKAFNCLQLLSLYDS